MGTLPPGKVPVAGNAVMAKEIDLRGAMRFDREFEHAVECLDRGLIDVKPILTGTVSKDEAVLAFAPGQVSQRASESSDHLLIAGAALPRNRMSLRPTVAAQSNAKDMEENVTNYKLPRRTLLAGGIGLFAAPALIGIARAATTLRILDLLPE